MNFAAVMTAAKLRLFKGAPYPKPVASVFLWRQAPEAARRRRFGVEASRLTLSRGPIAALGEGGESRVASDESSQGSAGLKAILNVKRMGTLFAANCFSSTE